MLRTMADPTSGCTTDRPDSNIDVNVEGHARRRCRLTLVRTARPLHQSCSGRVQGPGARGWRSSTASRHGSSTAIPWAASAPAASSAAMAARRAHTGRSWSGTSTRSTSGPTTRRSASASSTSAASTRKSSSRAPSDSGGQDLGMVDDPALRRLAIEIYNDGMAEIQADSGNRLLPMPIMPAWNVDDCVREAKRVAGTRRSWRQHDLGSAGPGRAGPGQPGVGPLLGGLRGPTAAGALPHRRQRHRR